MNYYETVRIGKRLTQKKLALTIGVPKATITALEKDGYLSLNTPFIVAFKIANYYNVSLDLLFKKV